ncbi:YoaK family protein [Acetobacter orientalis]|uniref:YoaK family protein n=1 Tax=Acetobacter orientalis TaxID=146474 RepID=UPI0039E8AA0E
MNARAGHDPRLVAAIILVTMAMGMLDAISLLHLKIFAGYMTATVLLMAVHIATSETIVLSGFEAIGFYLLGALTGGRLTRRDRTVRYAVGDILFRVGLLVGLTALVWAANPPGRTFITLGLLAFAMGMQTSATRHAKVADMSLPAATMLLHGLAHNSPFAGGRNPGTWRRLAAIGSLFVGAVIGTLVSSHSISGGIAMAGVTILSAGALLYLREHKFLHRFDNLTVH